MLLMTQVSDLLAEEFAATVEWLRRNGDDLLTLESAVERAMWTWVAEVQLQYDVSSLPAMDQGDRFEEDQPRWAGES